VWCHSGSTSDIIFVDEHFLRGFTLQNVGINVTFQVWEVVECSVLVMNDISGHVYRQGMLEMLFTVPMWILIPQVGVSSICDSFMVRLGFGGKQNVMNHLGLDITPMTIPIISLCLQVKGVECAGYGIDILYIMFVNCCMQYIEMAGKCSCTRAWTLLYHVGSIFLFLHIVALDAGSGV